jgi:hypothetical protein
VVYLWGLYEVDNPYALVYRSNLSTVILRFL